MGVEINKNIHSPSIPSPRISIGLPVYNGELYIEEAIESIINQTFTDFELIISDNASTDRTSEICNKYAQKDSRIRYYRQSQNHGACRNHNIVFKLARGEYFKWAAHDDCMSTDYLKKCVDVLDHYPDIVLCHTRIRFIHQDEGRVSNYFEKHKNINDSQMSRRFGEIITTRYAYLIFGVFRRHVLQQTSLLRNTIGSDRFLLAEMSLRGRFYEIPDYCFYVRDHKDRLSRIPLFYLHSRWWDTSKKVTTFVFPHWRHLIEYYWCLNRAHVHGKERRKCYIKLLLLLKNDIYWCKMLSDPLIALMPQSLKILSEIKQWIDHEHSLRQPAKRVSTPLFS